MKESLYILLLVIFILFTSCEELFIGPQPKFIDEQETPHALNIFGILRPDTIEEKPASLFNVSILVPALNDTNDTWFFDDAYIYIENSLPEKVNDTATFVYDTSNIEQKKYTNYYFSPTDLNTYIVTCYREGYDTVFGSTTIPAKAEILEYEYNKGILNIILKNDPSIYLFDIYTSPKKHNRILPKFDKNVTATQIYTSTFPVTLVIFTYDINLSEYYESINVFIKPNTFREPFSTVENGYGCIGSMNRSDIYVE